MRPREMDETVTLVSLIEKRHKTALEDQAKAKGKTVSSVLRDILEAAFFVPGDITASKPITEGQ